jgi:hypothetical protein
MKSTFINKSVNGYSIKDNDGKKMGIYYVANNVFKPAKHLYTPNELSRIAEEVRDLAIRTDNISVLHEFIEDDW